MDYLTAWREGHEEGMKLALKIINDMCETNFQKSSDVVLYIKQLEGDMNFKLPEPKKEKTKAEVKTDDLSTRDEKFIESLAEKIALKNWMWS